MAEKKTFEPFPNEAEPDYQDFIPVINSVPIVSPPFTKEAVYKAVEFITRQAQGSPEAQLVLERVDGSMDVIQIDGDTWMTIQKRPAETPVFGGTDAEEIDEQPEQPKTLIH